MCDILPQRIYVHEKQIKDEIEKNEKIKNAQKHKAYNEFYHKKYLPMRNKVENMTFYIDNVDSFAECAKELNCYWDEMMKFMKDNGISKNSKIHTNFMEEFSCYFLATIPKFEEFDIFIKDVFAGLKIQPDHSVTQIKKDVDFCIGRKLDLNFEQQDSLTLKIPAITVEIKTYVDATMLGEVMNTARKIKGANPGSKAILLTWINAFAEEHAFEAAYDSSIDEIVVLSTQKRKKGKPLVIEFTKEGLRDYYAVILQSMEEVMNDSDIPKMGRLLSYARHMNNID